MRENNNFCNSKNRSYDEYHGNIRNPGGGGRRGRCSNYRDQPKSTCRQIKRTVNGAEVTHFIWPGGSKMWIQDQPKRTEKPPAVNSSNNANEKPSKSCGGCEYPGFRHRRGCQNKSRPNNKPLEDTVDHGQQGVLTEKLSSSSNEKEKDENLTTTNEVNFEKPQEEQPIKLVEKAENTELPKEISECNKSNNSNKMSFNEMIAIEAKKTTKECVKVEKVIKKEKKSSDEEVICLGKLERFENLVDDDEMEKSECQTGSLQNSCLICDKEGHTSSQCQMICKNCSEPYHNLKMCPNPVNISVMLQQFFEFCMKQCCNYNPDQKFQPTKNNLSGDNNKKGKIKSASAKTLETSHSHRKRKRIEHSDSKKTSKSDSDSSSETDRTAKKRKKKAKSNDFEPQITPQYPNFSPFAQGLPFAAFSGHTTSAAFNPMMAFGPMIHGSSPMGIPR